jgi:hypothetical protein
MESKSNMLASLGSMFELAKGHRHEGEVKKALSVLSDQLEENANRSAKRNLTWRGMQQYLSSAAVILLLVGCVAVVCLIWIEASTL